MNHQDINGKIALFCGWTAPNGIWLNNKGKPQSIPNFCIDLNWIQMAEGLLGDDQKVKYIENLKDILNAHSNNYRSVFAKINASAFDKARALYKTIS